MKPSGGVYRVGRRVICAALALSAGLHEARADSDLRCGSRLVSTGMSAIDVVSRCGEPTFRDRWPPADPRLAGGRLLEQWTYNFGAGRLLAVLLFRDQRLQRIDDDGYGFFSDALPDCDASLSIGVAKYRLLTACGEPQQRRDDYRLRPVPDDRGRPAVLELIYREQWSYDRGPQRLLRTVQFENGRIVDVLTGARGQ